MMTEDKCLFSYLLNYWAAYNCQCWTGMFYKRIFRAPAGTTQWVHLRFHEPCNNAALSITALTKRRQNLSQAWALLHCPITFPYISKCDYYTTLTWITQNEHRRHRTSQLILLLHIREVWVQILAWRLGIQTVVSHGFPQSLQGLPG
jgi:hypothetical protein